MTRSVDGPSSKLFTPVTLRGGAKLADLRSAGVSKEMADAATFAPSGSCVSWGLPFKVGRAVVVKDGPVTVKLKQLKAQWLVFMHTSDMRTLEPDADGFIRPNARCGPSG